MKLYRIIALLALTVSLAAGLSACKREDDYFMRLQGQPVERQEYAIMAYDNLSKTALEYYEAYGADANEEGFWNREFDGKTPLERVKEVTDQELIKVKGIQVCALEEGLVKDISFPEFLKQYEAENEARADKSSKGEVIYGPVRLSMSQYYSYRQSGIEQALMEYVEQEKVTVTEQELEAYYPVVEAKESRKNFDASLVFYVWSMEEDPGKSEQFAAQVAGKENKGALTGEEIAAIAEEAGISLITQEARISTLEMGKEDLPYIKTVEAVKDVEAGMLSGVTELNENVEGLIRVLEKDYVPYGPYESVKTYVEQKYREKQAEEYLEKAVAGLKLEKGAGYGQLTYEELVEDQNRQ